MSYAMLFLEGMNKERLILHMILSTLTLPYGCNPCNCFKKYLSSADRYMIAKIVGRIMSWLARCCLEVELRDSSGSLKANCFDANAEFLFPITARKLTNKENATDKDFIRAIPTSSPPVLRLEPYRYEFACTIQGKLSIWSF